MGAIVPETPGRDRRNARCEAGEDGHLLSNPHDLHEEPIHARSLPHARGLRNGRCKYGVRSGLGCWMKLRSRIRRNGPHEGCASDHRADSPYGPHA